jgi:hypothetical protein
MTSAGMQHRVLLVLMLGMIAGFAAAGLAAEGPGTTLRGFLALQGRPARLITDFVATDGIGAALLNAAAVGLIGILLILAARIQLSGPTFAAVFTMMGFALFGKTPMNILPVILGVFLAARMVGRSFSEFILIALFGTAIGPVVSLVAWELGLSGLPAVAAGIAAGVAAGIILPSIAMSMLHLHQGYNLYNVGLSCGFLALFAASLIRAGGIPVETVVHWYDGDSLILVLLVPVLSILLILTALLSCGKGCMKGLVAIQRLSGRLPSDFMDVAGMGGALLNAGLVGIVASLGMLAVGADFNGPSIGGLLTIIGFGAFGTHLRNSWPLVLGVVLAALLFRMPLTAPGVVLAALFCTTLAPLAGEFGLMIGLTAGFLHLAMVLQTGAWQGGINLYNNGFAGGLTATLIVSVIAWVRSERGESS